MQKTGFSLIELMVVVAVIGILAVIAIPSYRDYTIRSRISEALVMFNPVKAEVEEFYNTKGRLPNANEVKVVGKLGADNNLASSTVTKVNTGIVESIFVYDRDGGVNVRFEAIINPNIFPTGSLTSTTPIVQIWPTINSTSGTLIWTCGTSPSGSSGSKHIPFRFLPSSCHNIVPI